MDTLDRPLEWNLYKYAYTFQGGVRGGGVSFVRVTSRVHRL